MSTNLENMLKIEEDEKRREMEPMEKLNEIIRLLKQIEYNTKPRRRIVP